MNLFEKINLSLFVPSVLLTTLSVVVLLSLDADLAKRQLLFALVGLALFFLFSSFDFLVLSVFWKALWVFSNLLLLTTLIIGISVKGSLRWIDLGIFRFQPSEFIKIVMIVVLSVYFNAIKKGSFRELLFGLFLFLPVTFLVFLQPDLGTALVFGFFFFLMFLESKFSKKYLLIFAIFVGLVSTPVWNLLQDYQKDRLIVFMNPYSDPLGAGYNVIQSQIAVGSGLLFGKGFGHGTQSHLKFLPEFHTDFIFASFAEEWGFFGVTILLVLYALILISILRLMRSLNSGFEYFVCLGVFAMLLFQIFINIGMNLGIMPVTGIPLPLMSYGGSSLLLNFIALGIVNFISIKKSRGLLE